MTLHHDTRPLSIDLLGPDDLVETFAFLDRDPIVNVYLAALVLRDALGHARDQFLAARRDDAIVALLYLGPGSGAILPVGDDRDALRRLADEAAARLASFPRRFQIIGTRPAVRPFLARFAEAGRVPRLERDQTYMALERGDLAEVEPLPELRPAGPEDQERMFESGVRLRTEELEEDPRRADALAYARRVEEECRDGHTFVWADEDGLRFRASVSARTADAAQISGVYTLPLLRNRGIATRGVAELCRRLFGRSAAACLFVNDLNAPAIAVYRKLGFTARAEWYSAFYTGER